MMRRFSLAAVAVMMAQPALAADPQSLTCMAQSYTAEQQGQLDNWLPSLKIDEAGNDPVANQMGEMIFIVTSGCKEMHGWSDTQFQPAFLFEFGRIMELAFTRYGPMTREEIARLEATLAKGDRAALWSALEGEVISGMSGEAATTSTGNAMLYGQFMIEAGFGLDATKAEQIGIFLGAKAMQRYSEREFGAQK